VGNEPPIRAHFNPHIVVRGSPGKKEEGSPVGLGRRGGFIPVVRQCACFSCLWKKKAGRVNIPELRSEKDLSSRRLPFSLKGNPGGEKKKIPGGS